VGESAGSKHLGSKGAKRTAKVVGTLCGLNSVALGSSINVGARRFMKTHNKSLKADAINGAA
jgi:hypothetical protein